jgi:tetratricopeptide (TPR) repeat protein
MERRLAVLARTAVIAAASLLATSASAAPKGADAKAAFDRGVAAYKKADYVAASDELGKSFALEADADTLYAWAQTERKLNHCDKAIELYGKLLAMDLPAANKAAVQTQIDECTAIVAAQQPSEPTPPPVSPAPAPPAPSIEPPPPVHDQPSRWLNPVGLGLIGVGVLGLGAGSVFLVQAKGADSDKDKAMTYGDFERFEQRATSRGRLGLIAAASGGVLLTAGIVYIVTRKQTEQLPVAVVVDAAGASVVASGRF